MRSIQDSIKEINDLEPSSSQPQTGPLPEGFCCENDASEIWSSKGQTRLRLIHFFKDSIETVIYDPGSPGPPHGMV